MVANRTKRSAIDDRIRAIVRATVSLNSPVTSTKQSTEVTAISKYNPPAFKAINPTFDGYPEYPSRAKASNIEGSVDLQITINANGEVIDVVVVSSTNHMFTRSAVKFFRYINFKVSGLTESRVLNQHIDFRVNRN